MRVSLRISLSLFVECVADLRVLHDASIDWSTPCFLFRSRRNSHRCVRRPGKYGFKPSRENKDGFYAHWEKPWTFGDTPLKILPYGRVFRQHTQQSVTPGGGTVTRVRKVLTGPKQGKRYVMDTSGKTRWRTGGSETGRLTGHAGRR